MVFKHDFFVYTVAKRYNYSVLT